MVFKAVIWDMGGVLLRTEDGGPRTQLAKKFGLTRYELEDIVFGVETCALAEAGDIPEEEHHAAIADRLGVPVKNLPEIIEKFFAGDRMDMELIDTIRTLKKSVKVGLLSNALSSARRDIHNKYGILNVFDDTIFSAEVKLAKPDPAIYKLSLSRLGVQASEAIFVDDNLDNIQAANALGMTTIHFIDPQTTCQRLEELLG